MQFYFDESGDTGSKTGKGSSKTFSIAIVAVENPEEKIIEIKKKTDIKNLYKYNKLNRKEKALVKDCIFEIVESYNIEILNKNEHKDSAKIVIQSVLDILKKSPYRNMKIFYEGEHLKKIFLKISKKSNKKVSFVPATKKEDHVGVLVADLVAGSIRFNKK